ncbi:MAG: hypothetical protein JOZ38_10565, partial [Candidatus Eremiobacteraeota bacterium]|nr:hypothetical protein [Candidatus Eremiobacteraeota bacterium]
MIATVEIPYHLPAPAVKPHIDAGLWSTVMAAILGLVAFVLGLSFSQAEGRFDVRRNLVITEANAIGTTWLRANQLPPQDAVRFRSVLTDYTATLLDAYEHVEQESAFVAAESRAIADQNVLWTIASDALRKKPMLGHSLLVQTLNDTIDLSAEQRAQLQQHVPTFVAVLMIL